MKGQTRSVLEVILFTILTCGIYHLYWIYATTNEVNYYLNDNDTSGDLVLLFTILTCGIYGIYWYYKMGRKVAAVQQKTLGFGTDDSIVYVVLCIFGFSIISTAIIQSNLNKAWESI